MNKKYQENLDYYLENGMVVFTSHFHLQRGYCCGNGCRHCPYTPKHTKDTKKIDDKKSN